MKTAGLHLSRPKASGDGRSLLGGDLSVGVLKEEGADSTPTLFFHTVGRVESGGYEFNTKERGGDCR